MKYWLMKSEPDVFGIDDLKNVKVEPWDGVRNYQARNMMRDQMKKGDKVFFYHSSCKVPGIVGIMKVLKEGHPDFSALDPESKYYDPKSTVERPRWFMVSVGFVKKFERTISLEELKKQTALQNMPLVRKGSRLSIMPVTKTEWETILSLS